LSLLIIRHAGRYAAAATFRRLADAGRYADDHAAAFRYAYYASLLIAAAFAATMLPCRCHATPPILPIRFLDFVDDFAPMLYADAPIAPFAMPLMPLPLFSLFFTPLYLC